MTKTNKVIVSNKTRKQQQIKITLSDLLKVYPINVSYTYEITDKTTGIIKKMSAARQYRTREEAEESVKEMKDSNLPMFANSEFVIEG